MSYRDALDQCMDAHHLALKPYIELGSAAMLAEMVERGMGLRSCRNTSSAMSWRPTAWPASTLPECRDSHAPPVVLPPG